MVNLPLKVKVKVTGFKLVQNLLMINEQLNKCKGNIPNGFTNLKVEKLIFCKFQAQFDLEGQGQGH